jgi:hypothetical protein
LEKVAETQRKERKVYALQKSEQMFSWLAKNTWLEIEIAQQEGLGISYLKRATQSYGFSHIVVKK